MLDTRGLVIGELAVREHFLTREQLDEVISHQQRNGFTQPLGALIVALAIFAHERFVLLPHDARRGTLVGTERDGVLAGLPRLPRLRWAA